MPTPARPARDYDALLGSLRVDPAAGAALRLQSLCDAAWNALAPTGVSWFGFYAADPNSRTRSPAHPITELELVARRDKPACSPIGLHGACGRSFLSRRCLVVRDVKSLGESYIACDPRDRSEVVVPMLDPQGECWGVLDVDSYDANCFDERDARELFALCATAGLTTGACPAIDVI